MGEDLRLLRQRQTRLAAAAQHHPGKSAAASDERLARLLSSSPAVVYSFQATGDFAPTFVSVNIRDVLGYEPDAYLENADFWRERVHPDDLAEVKAEAANLFQTGHQTTEYRFRRQDGSWCWVRDEQRLITDTRGEPVEVIGSWSDITAHKQLSEALLAAQDRLVRLLSSAPAVIYSYRASGDFAPIFVSETIRAVLGYEPRQYLENAEFWRERVHPDDLEAVEAEVGDLFKTGRITTEYRFRKRDGSYCWVSDEQRLISDVHGEAVEVVGSWSDIGERKRAEEAAADAQARLKRLLASSPTVIYSYKASGDFAPTFVSETIKAVFGYEPNEYLENADFWRERVHPDELAAVEAEGAKLFKTGHHTTEYRFRTKDGSYCWVRDEQRVIRNGYRESVEVVGSWSDISARKRAEAAAAAAQVRIEHLLASSPTVIYSFKAGGDYAPTFISRNVKDLLGYDPEDYLQNADFWTTRIHPEDSERVLKDYARLLKEGRLSYEYRFRKKDGSYCWISDELQLLRDAAGKPVEVVGAWSDVTARKKLGEALVAAQDRLVRLLSSAPAVIYSFKARDDYAPTIISENIRAVFGYEPSEYLENADFWRERVHPDELAAVEAEAAHLFKAGHHTTEYRFRRKDGSYCWVNDEQRLIRDEQGEPFEVIGSWSDVTARKQSEQRLSDAIETVTYGFSLYDAEDRLIVCNRAYGDLLYPGLGMPEPGTPYETLIRNAAERGMIAEAKGRVDEWVAERLVRHRNPGEPHVQRRSDGRWVLINERRTAEGGIVAVYTNITDIKRAEEELRQAKLEAERASELVTEKNRALEVLSTKLSKYLSPQVYSSIFSGQRNVEIASNRKKLTVFFSDIVDFTETTDSLESEELTELLNHYLTEMSKIALDHGATIDKYIGDAILAFFGDPETRGVKEDAMACVEMAMAMQRRMRELQSDWRDVGLEKPFQLRIGINTGYCTVGNFGSEDRMDYTIIGNEVNLASRLQSFADHGSILVSHATYSLVKDRVAAEEQAPIEAKGFAKPVRNYRVLDRFDTLAGEGRVIREEQDGLKLVLDLQKLDKARAAETLAAVVARLKA